MNKFAADAPRPVAPEVDASDESDSRTSDDTFMAGQEVARIVRRSSRSQKRYRRSMRVRTLKLVLAATIFFALVVVLLLWLQIGSLQSERADAVAQLDASQRQVQNLNAELAQAVKDRDALVKGRIPGLTPLVYDRAIAVKHKYVRNIIFTITGSSKKHTYEYRIVLSNGELSVVNPQVKILLFDARGIQIGAASVEKVDAITRSNRITLDPGETRSYSSSIPVNGTEHPKYFLLQIQ